MHQFSFLLFNVLAPIFMQVGSGYVVQKRFAMDISSLGKVQFYILIPALVFGSIYRTPLDSSQLLHILICNFSVFIMLFIVGLIAARLLKLDSQRSHGLYNAVCLYNSGNYCIPLIQLIYNSTPFSYSVQIIVLLLQSALTSTFGVLNIDRQKRGWAGMLMSLFRLPATWAMLAAVICRLGGWVIWKPLEESLDSLASGLVPLALVTLGAQLASSKFPRPSIPVSVTALLRLLGGPALAFCMVHALGIHGVAGQVIVICAGAPCAVNTVLLSIEFKGDANFASQTVLLSTVLSAITMPLVISFALAFV